MRLRLRQRWCLNYDVFRYGGRCRRDGLMARREEWLLRTLTRLPPGRSPGVQSVQHFQWVVPMPDPSKTSWYSGRLRCYRRRRGRHWRHVRVSIRLGDSGWGRNVGEESVEDRVRLAASRSATTGTMTQPNHSRFLSTTLGACPSRNAQVSRFPPTLPTALF
jgi:hypothetical protein